MEIQQILVEYFNILESSDSISTLDELSDGNLLYEIIQTASPENFDSSLIKQAVERQQKISNLNQLKADLENYYNNKGVSLSEFETFDAQKLVDVEQGIVGLCRIVLGAAIMTENNQLLISRMKMLNENMQTKLIEFLSPISSRFETQQISSPIDLESELHQYQFAIAEQQAKNAHLKKELDKRTKDFQEINDRFNYKQVKHRKYKNQTNAEKVELSNQLQYKEQVLRNLKNELESTGEKLKQENLRLKDELDITKNKLLQSQSNQQTLDRYKRKLEEMADLQQRYKELEKNNAQLSKKVKQQTEELEKKKEIERGYEFFKNSFNQEKEKVAASESKLADKEATQRQADLKIKELTEENHLLASRLGESYRRVSDTPENISGVFEFKDVGLDLTQELEEQLQKLQMENQTLLQNFQKQEQSMTKEEVAEILSTKAQLEENLCKVQSSNKQLKMENDDLQFEVDKLKREVKLFKQDIDSLKEKLQNSDQNISESSQKNSQLVEDCEKLKLERLNSVQEIQDIIREKDQINTKYIQMKEECLQKNLILHEKEKQLQAQVKEKSDLDNQMMALLANEQILKKQIEEFNQSKLNEESQIKIMALQKDKLKLEYDQQISNLNSLVKETHDNMSKLQEEKEKQKGDFDRNLEENKILAKKKYSEKSQFLKQTIGQQQVEIEHLTMTNLKIQEDSQKETQLIANALYSVGQKMMKNIK